MGLFAAVQLMFPVNKNVMIILALYDFEMWLFVICMRGKL
jgi:hypothetical protein